MSKAYAVNILNAHRTAVQIVFWGQLVLHGSKGAGAN